MIEETQEYVVQCALLTGTLSLLILFPIGLLTRSKAFPLLVSAILIALVWIIWIGAGVMFGLGWTYAPGWHKQAAEISTATVIGVMIVTLVAQHIWAKAKGRNTVQ